MKITSHFVNSESAMKATRILILSPNLPRVKRFITKDRHFQSTRLPNELIDVVMFLPQKITVTSKSIPL